MGNRTNSQAIGDIGEKIAELFLVKHGYLVICRNYRKKMGEIDIVCEKDDRIFFVEVKTISCNNISRETADHYRPEDNLHSQKLIRMERAISVYIEENNIERDWEILGVMILLDTSQKRARVKLLKDFAW